MGRTGKIARLPSATREELNGRIEDGKAARPLLVWLNARPEVEEVLWEHFAGRPITEQNLSEWRQRGFLDWQRRLEARELARDFIHEAEELEDEVGETPLTDRLTEMVALSLARLMREAVNDGAKGPERLAAVVGLAREFSRLRRGDHAMQRLRVEEEMREEAEREDDVQEFVESYKKIQWQESLIKAGHDARRRDFANARREGRLSSEEEKEQSAALAKTEEYLTSLRVRGPLPTRWDIRRQLDPTRFHYPANPSKSNQIKAEPQAPAQGPSGIAAIAKIIPGY